MMLESLSSPHRRSPSLSYQPTYKRFPGRDDLISWSVLLERHRFLLSTLALLAFLCTIYLYFAVTLGGAGGSCSGLSGTQKALCEAKSLKLHAGKMKFF